MKSLPPSPDDAVVYVDSDEPGDNTVRPCRPERRALLEKERELLNRWGKRDDATDEQARTLPIPLNVDSDEPGDNTIRPCRPERRALLEKERELLNRWGAAQNRAEAASSCSSLRCWRRCCPVAGRR